MPANPTNTKLLQLIGGTYGAAKYLLAGNFTITDLIIGNGCAQFWIEPPTPAQEALLPPIHHTTPHKNLPLIAYSEFRVNYRVIWELPTNDMPTPQDKQEASHV